MRSFALAIAALLLLSSCTDEPQPIEPSASPSAKPTTTAPPLPESARKNTPAGAANFVKHWIEVSNYSAQTGDTKQLRTISEPDCDGCNAYIELYEATYSKGGYFKGGDRRIGEVDMEIGKDEVYVRGELHADEGSYRKTETAHERTSKPEVTPVVFATRFANTRWRMTQVGLDSKG